MKPETKHISAERLTAFMCSLFTGRGMGQAQAQALADVLVWADLRGVSSHGMARLSMYLRFLDDGQMDPKATPEIDSRAPALFVVKGNRCAGPLAMKLALEEAGKRARAFGVSTAIISGTTHTGAIGRYAHAAAEQGFAAIMLNSGPPNMAYHGARVKSLATSPIAIGLPTMEGPLVLDMATATIANGRLQQAVRSGEAIPAGCALTKDGTPTTNAAEADILLPLGGPKGSGLSFMFECLTSVLAANPILLSIIGSGAKGPHVHNAMLILIDIAAMRPLDEFKREMSAFGAVVHDLPRLDPDAAILLPGERGARNFERRSREGIPLTPKTLAGLVELAEKAGVAPPQLM